MSQVLRFVFLLLNINNYIDLFKILIELNAKLCNFIIFVYIALFYINVRMPNVCILQ